MFTDHLDPTHPDAGRAAGNVAEVYRIQGRHAEAERYYSIEWRVARRHDQGDDLVRAETLSRLGMLYGGAGRLDLAERCLRQAIALRERADGHATDIAWDYRALALAYNRAGRPAEAARAVAAGERLYSSDDGLRLERTRCLVATGDHRAAGPVVRDLLAAEASRKRRNVTFAAAIRVVLAEVVTREGDPERGELLLRVAINTIGRVDGPRSPDYAAAVAAYHRLFPDDREAVAEHAAAIRAAARAEELRGPEWVLGGPP